MTRPIILALAIALACPVASLAQPTGATAAALSGQAPGVRVQAGEVDIRVQIVELDMARRTATLRGTKGKLVMVDVPDTVKNFDQVRVGDQLVVRYAVAVVAQLEPTAKRSGITERIESSSAASAAAGGMPGTASRRTVEVLAIIEALDRKAGTATLRGVKRTITMAVPPSVDISKLKVGDEVRATFAEAAVISVERAAPRP